MVDRLTDDCLMRIFRNLSASELIKIERVCRRWRDVSLTSWYLRPDKSLDFRDFVRLHDSDERALHIVESLLKRHGQFLKKIILSLPKNRIPSVDILQPAAPHLGPKLSELHIHGVPVSPDGLRILAQNCQELRWLCLHDLKGTFESELALLLKRNQNLKGLMLQSVDSLRGSCLASIGSEHFHHLSIRNCEHLDLSHLENNTSRLQNFQLDLRRSNVDMVPMMSNLTNLGIWSANANLSDDLLAKIGSQCRQLSRVRLMFVKSVTKRGFKAIIDLPRLTHLVLLDLSDKLQDAWELKGRAIPQLRHLELNLWNLSNMSLLGFVKQATSLESLVLVNCEIPDKFKFVEELGEAVRGRLNDVVLELRIEGFKRLHMRVRFDEGFYRMGNVAEAIQYS